MVTTVLFMHLLGTFGHGFVASDPVHADRLTLLRQTLAIEDGIAVAAGHTHSPRTRLHALEPIEYDHGFEFRVDGRQVAKVSVRSYQDQPRVTNYLGIEYFRNSADFIDATVADDISANLFRDRRQTFRSICTEQLLQFAQKQGVVFDSFSVHFDNEVPKPEDPSDSVVIMGYLDDIPSFLLQSVIGSQGMVSKLTLSPGVFVDNRYLVNLTPTEALSIAKSREKEDFPLTWENVFVEFAYSDLRPNGLFRSAPTVPFRQWEAYPVCYVRPYKVHPSGFSWRET
jgi:hypothetical protein